MRSFRKTLLRYITRSSSKASTKNLEESGVGLLTGEAAPVWERLPSSLMILWLGHQLPASFPLSHWVCFAHEPLGSKIFPGVNLDIWTRCSGLPINPSWCPGRGWPWLLLLQRSSQPPGQCGQVQKAISRLWRSQRQPLPLLQMCSHTGFGSLPEILFFLSC